MGAWFWVTMETNVHRIRVGVSEDNVGNSSRPSSEVIVTQTSESRRTCVASPHKKIEKPEYHGQRRRREDEGIETNQQDENEDEIEQVVDRIFAGTNSDARSRSSVMRRRAVQTRTPPKHPGDHLEVSNSSNETPC